MISYSDYVLSTKPWLYAPLNDAGLTAYLNEDHLMMDVSGKERHMTVLRDSVTYQVEIPGLHDSVPIRGISAPAVGFAGTTALSESGARLWLSSGVPKNDVYESLYYSHDLWYNRVRAEWLMTSGNGPTLNIGGLSFWVSGSMVTVAVNVYQLCSSGGAFVASATYSKAVYTTTSTGSRRVILEMIYHSPKSATIRAAINGAVLFDEVVVLPPAFVDGRGYTCSETFTYPTNWMDVAYFGGATISNLSIHRGSDLPNLNDYVTRSWDALTTVYEPGLNANISHLSDNVNTSRIVDAPPNSAVAQLDTLLIRGFSHRISNELTVVTDSGTSTVTVLLPQDSIPERRIDFHDFSIGDTISLDGCAQEELNRTWRIESITGNSVSFSMIGTVSPETGVFMVKRAPIGGGAWTRGYSGTNALYTSSSSTLGENGLLVDDTSKAASVLKIYSAQATSQTLYLKRNLKRASSHYQPDTRQDRPEWTIIGDHKRFYLVIAYKQNPKTHSHLIVFGEIKDWVTDEWRTVLVGYVDDSIGNVGFNSVFAYPEWSILSSGHLLCQSREAEGSSGAAWVRSDVDGDYSYLMGTYDCGQRMYPIPVPYTTY